MTQPSESSYEAYDAPVSANSGQPAERPPMQHELDYLDARVEETGAAVKKIKAQIKGLQRSLREAEELHEDAKKAKKAGRDLPEVQRRRAR